MSSDFDFSDYITYKAIISFEVPPKALFAIHSKAIMIWKWLLPCKKVWNFNWAAKKHASRNITSFRREIWEQFDWISIILTPALSQCHAGWRYDWVIKFSCKPRIVTYWITSHKPQTLTHSDTLEMWGKLARKSNHLKKPRHVFQNCHDCYDKRQATAAYDKQPPHTT